MGMGSPPPARRRRPALAPRPVGAAPAVAPISVPRQHLSPHPVCGAAARPGRPPAGTSRCPCPMTPPVRSAGPPTPGTVRPPTGLRARRRCPPRPRASSRRRSSRAVNRDMGEGRASSRTPTRSLGVPDAIGYKYLALGENAVILASDVVGSTARCRQIRRCSRVRGPNGLSADALVHLAQVARVERAWGSVQFLSHGIWINTARGCLVPEVRPASSCLVSELDSSELPVVDDGRAGWIRPWQASARPSRSG